MSSVVITSFGYGHAEPPQADLTVDVRHSLRNPHADPRMRDLTGLDHDVRVHVMSTPGADGMVSGTAAAAKAFLADRPDSPIRVAWGCVGGRHRSVALAQELALVLLADGVDATVEHRDVAKPVIQH